MIQSTYHSTSINSLEFVAFPKTSSLSLRSLKSAFSFCLVFTKFANIPSSLELQFSKPAEKTSFEITLVLVSVPKQPTFAIKPTLLPHSLIDYLWTRSKDTKSIQDRRNTHTYCFTSREFYRIFPVLLIHSPSGCNKLFLILKSEEVGWISTDAWSCLAALNIMLWREDIFERGPFVGGFANGF